MRIRASFVIVALIACGQRAAAQASSASTDSIAAALYARALAAESPDSARKDYLRIAVDFSRSPRAEDALLQLAQLEIARGDRAAAKQYLERLALEHPNGASRARGAYLLGRARADEGAMVPACALLAEAKAKVAATDVELSNQIGFAARPCAAVQHALQHALDSARTDSIDKVARSARADSTARADSIARAEAAAKKTEKTAKKAPKKEAVKKTARKTTKPEPAETTGAGWSAQVAAYDSQDAADALAKKLHDRGYEARVTGEKPFRVRIGRYPSRAAAADLVGQLKSAKIAAIVVEAEKP